MNIKTIQARGHLTRAGHRRFDEVLVSQCDLYNAALLQRQQAYRTLGRVPLSLRVQSRELTDLRANSPEFAGIDRRLEIGTLARLDKAYDSAFRKLREGNRKPGFPRRKHPRYFNTVEIYSGINRYLRRADNGKAYMKIKGMPMLEIRKTGRIPDEGQPKDITVTRYPNGVYVGISFEFPSAEPTPLPPESPVGVNRGVARRSTTSGNVIIPRRDRSEWNKKKRRLLRKMQRQRDAALREGRATMVFRGLDPKTKRLRLRFKWIKLSNSYIETLLSYLKASHRENVRNRSEIHQTTTELARGHDAIFVEDFQIPGMVASAKGTREEPGTNVTPKTELNRTILKQSWGILAAQLAYKAKHMGKLFARVASEYISRTCPFCGHVSGDVHEGRTFTCGDCDFSGDIDVVAAWHILSRGLDDANQPPVEIDSFPRARS